MTFIGIWWPLAFVKAILEPMVAMISNDDLMPFKGEGFKTMYNAFIYAD